MKTLGTQSLTHTSRLGVFKFNMKLFLPLRWSGGVTFQNPSEVIFTSHLVICCWANGAPARPDTLTLTSECLIASGPWGNLENTRWSQSITCRGLGLSHQSGLPPAPGQEYKKDSGWRGAQYRYKKISVQFGDQYWDLAAELSQLHKLLVGQSDSLNGRRQHADNDRSLNLVLASADLHKARALKMLTALTDDLMSR